ncbi:MAG: hypothetical protein U1E76_08595 [Planctomycetota bacterium]
MSSGHRARSTIALHARALLAIGEAPEIQRQDHACLVLLVGREQRFREPRVDSGNLEAQLPHQGIALAQLGQRRGRILAAGEQLAELEVRIGVAGQRRQRQAQLGFATGIIARRNQPRCPIVGFARLVLALFSLLFGKHIVAGRQRRAVLLVQQGFDRTDLDAGRPDREDALEVRLGAGVITGKEQSVADPLQHVAEVAGQIGQLGIGRVGIAQIMLGASEVAIAGPQLADQMTRSCHRRLLAQGLFGTVASAVLEALRKLELSEPEIAARKRPASLGNRRIALERCLHQAQPLVLALGGIEQHLAEHERGHRRSAIDGKRASQLLLAALELPLHEVQSGQLDECLGAAGCQPLGPLERSHRLHEVALTHQGSAERDPRIIEIGVPIESAFEPDARIGRERRILVPWIEREQTSPGSSTNLGRGRDRVDLRHRRPERGPIQQRERSQALARHPGWPLGRRRIGLVDQRQRRSRAPLLSLQRADAHHGELADACT